MPGLGGLLLVAMAGVGPNGWMLGQGLAELQGPVPLPVESLIPVTQDLWLVPHEEPAWSMVFYTPPKTPLFPMMIGQAERLLPEVSGPRLFLRSNIFEPGALDHLAVDAAEYLYRTLLEVHLHQEVEREGSPYRLVAARRATDLMLEVPAEHRRTAYLSAVADFGGHLFSIANEVNRASRRAQDLGRDPCLLLRRKAPLLRLWETSFESSPYTGRYPKSSQRPGWPQVEWVETRRALEAQDKKLFLSHILGDVWRGTMDQDLAALCP